MSALTNLNVAPTAGPAPASLHDSMSDSIGDSVAGVAAPLPAAPASSRPIRHGGVVPPMPRIGLPESAYLHAAKQAERNGDDLTLAAAKVGQYVTLAVKDPDQSWEKKLKFFRHALKRHCQPPPHADDITKAWFERLSKLVRKHCGGEALRLASEMDDCFEARQSMGQSVDQLADDAERFFDKICPITDKCPSVYNEEDWNNLRIFRDRWV